MLIKKTWTKKKGLFINYFYEGYFLFGFIPIFISRTIVQ